MKQNKANRWIMKLNITLTDQKYILAIIINKVVNSYNNNQGKLY